LAIITVNRMKKKIRINVSILLALFIFIQGCIVPYEAEIDEEYSLVSIEGSLIKGSQENTLVISRTSSLGYPEYKPIEGCLVSVVDDLNTQSFYSEDGNGRYTLEIPDEQLVFGRQYKLQIVTPEGKLYESEYETLIHGAEVDTVYYQMEDTYDKIANMDLNGVQFYIDLKAEDSISRYFRWIMEETYEITSIAPITYFLTGDEQEPVGSFPTEYELFRCWKTETVKRLFLSNTINLVVNEKKRIPLNYVSTESERLKIKYSLLVKQFTLSEGAYSYWQKAKNETQDAGGLYTQQPGRAISNVYCPDDSTEIVLGYFWLSHCTENRVFVPGIPSINITGNHCELEEFDPAYHANGPFPRYVWNNQVRSRLMTSSIGCFDCTKRGGNLNKPDYWK